MFRVVVAFADMQDEHHVYSVGDTFPRTGKKVSKERVNELVSGRNQIGKPLIEEVAEKTETKEVAKKAKRRKKNAD